MIICREGHERCAGDGVECECEAIAYSQGLDDQCPTCRGAVELVRVEGDDIVIRITPDVLTHATEHGVLCTFIPQTGNFRATQITDLPKWRDAVVRALRREQENGDTPVHLMLDEALEYAADQGEEGISIEGILP